MNIPKKQYLHIDIEYTAYKDDDKLEIEQYEFFRFEEQDNSSFVCEGVGVYTYAGVMRIASNLAHFRSEVHVSMVRR